MFAGNVVGATGAATYHYITRYIKIKRLIKSVDDTFKKIKDDISDEAENKEIEV